MFPLPDWIYGVHHDGSEAYVSNPLPKLGDLVTIKLRIPPAAPLNYAYIRAALDGETHMVKLEIVQKTPVANIWAGKLKIQQPRTDYRFKLLTNEGAYYYNAIGVSQADSPEYYDFTILADYDAPLWVRECVFYQIFPDRFYNGDPSNDVTDGAWMREGKPTRQRTWGELPMPWRESRSVDFFGGDLQGVTQKLDYLTDLGVNGVYLTPIFKAGSNHRYDVIDFMQVDPHLGGNEALAELRTALDEREMRLMLDITPNHVGVTNVWFEAAKQDRHAPEAEFFFYDPDKEYFETWLGVSSLIKLNYSSSRLRDLMYRLPDSAMRRWLLPPYRIDSWRFDVANMTGNLRHLQLDHAIWQEMRPYLKGDNPALYMMGEYFPDGTPHTQGDELDAAMNYSGFNIPVRRWLGGEDVGVQDNQPYADSYLMPTEGMALQWRRFMAAVPYVIALQQFGQLDSHDTTRILHVTGGDKELVKLGVALLMAFPGVPCLYYGSEVGMEGNKDPDNRRCMIWDDEDAWDKHLLNYHKKLIALRKNTPALKQGGFQLLYAEGDLVVFMRESVEQTLVFVGYRGTGNLPETAIPMVNGGIADGTVLKDLLSEAEFTVTNGTITLEGLPRGTAMLLEALYY